MHKQKSKRNLGLAAIAIALFAFPNHVLAGTEHLLVGGFGSTSDLRWTSTLSSSYLNDYVIPGVNGWNGISSKVKLTRITSGTYQINVLTGTNPTYGVVGEMIPYCSNGSSYQCIATTPWGSARVYGYTNQITNTKLTKTEIISNVYCHEFGHALSLAHNDNDLPTVMRASIVTNVLPQGPDKSHLKGKWGN